MRQLSSKLTNKIKQDITRRLRLDIFYSDLFFQNLFNANL